MEAHVDHIKIRELPAVDTSSTPENQHDDTVDVPSPENTSVEETPVAPTVTPEAPPDTAPADPPPVTPPADTTSSDNASSSGGSHSRPVRNRRPPNWYHSQFT